MLNKMLQGKKVIVGITGCIAAYKACLLIRDLITLGAEVRVVMTPSATKFITPLTVSTLSGNPVITDIFPAEDSSTPKTWHIDYAIWADIVIIAPATVNTCAKIAHGFADNPVTTIAMSARSPLLISPAADVDMYERGVTKENFKKLAELGYYVLPADEGFLASGLSGKGRFPEIEKIIKAAQILLAGYKKDLTDKKILVSAGPTYEDVDPVRFIGNRSSGKMGFELAKAACLRGASVTVVSGPSHLSAFQEIEVIKVRSAVDMQKAIQENLSGKDILIMAAAVADYKAKDYNTKKIKKENKLEKIELVENPDILASLKNNSTSVTGFALETENELDNALGKMKRKNLDYIVLNSLNDANAGFEFDTNKVKILSKDGKTVDVPLSSKFEVANRILDVITQSK